jgi:hypothetical protein
MFEPATLAQINYIKILCEKTCTDPDDYNFAEMTKGEASEIIGYLRGDK